MPPKAENIVAFLEKRGHKADVQEVVPGTFKISLYSKSVDDVVGLFAGIQDGSRFIVAVHHPDFFELVENGIGIDAKLQNIKDTFQRDIINQSDAIGKTLGEVEETLNSVISGGYKELDSKISELNQYISSEIIKITEVFQLHNEAMNDIDNRLKAIETKRTFWDKVLRRNK